MTLRGMASRSRLTRKLDAARRRLAEAKASAATEKTRVKKLKAALAALPPRSKKLWHPAAIRSPQPTPGPFRGGGPKLVWHTVEGYGLPVYAGSTPHFTVSIKTGQLWQHLPINTAAATLKAGTGNYSNSIQVEITDAFAKDSPNWTDEQYDVLRRLARWIEFNGDVPRKTSVKFSTASSRLSVEEFHRYTGHIGHQHAPAPNDHWDPGALRIDKILEVRT